MILTFRPLVVWPHAETRNRRWAPFSASYSQTLKLLDTELTNLGARNVLLGVVASERDVRVDGQMRADAKVRHPGVELSFDSRYGRLTYATDVCDGGYNRPGWQQNLRSIALGLEALRAVDRYGVSTRGQQYAGWRALPMSAGEAGMPSNLDEAQALIRTVAHVPADTRIGKAAIREALRLSHPDTGGSADLFRRVQAALKLLEAA